MKRKGLPLNGWLILDKPLCITSTQALGRVRWLLNAAKAGHGGTLDPAASGILPLAFGEATKTVQYVMDARKRYRFTVRWGERTSTDDAEGEVLASSPVRPSLEQINAVLPRFLGEISQIPPAVSAIKVDGERAYDLVRAGETVELKARIVRIDSLELLEIINENEASFEVACGKGTYVRAIARDMAQLLGTEGHVCALRRLQVGRFSEKDAISLDSLEQKVHNTPAEQLLLPLETALDDIPALVITEQEAQRLRLGQRISLLQMSCKDRLLALPADVRDGSHPLTAQLNGKVVAIGEMAAGEFRTVRLLHNS